MKRLPTRVRLSRRKDCRMPANSVKVDRTTRFGNPFDVREYGLELSLRLFEDTIRGSWLPGNVAHVDDPTAQMLHEAHHRWLRRIGGRPIDAVRAELRGRNLACWCPLPACGDDDECHAAILLRVANE